MKKLDFFILYLRVNSKNLSAIYNLDEKLFVRIYFK